MIIAQVSVTPIGTGSTSISSFVAEAVKVLRDSSLNVVVTSMGTIVEVENLEKLFKAVEKCHEVLYKAGAKRIYTIIIIDDRRDVERRIDDKVKSIEEKLSR